ncbi:hypothetical protein DMUE_5613 [Dictyocoela muelleri]|nr:hypothetical protein DMUE_5613 [Dictyocoela muelleri]
MYKYIKGAIFVEIAYELYLDRHPVSSYSDIARESICVYVDQNSDKLGGFDENNFPKVVEIDESLFFKRKYNRGRLTDGQWYIGGIERGKNVFIETVNNRNKQIILRVIQENVRPGTIVITN